MTNHIAVWLAENGFGKIVRRESVGGGCINDTERLHLDAGNSLFFQSSYAKVYNNYVEIIPTYNNGSTIYAYIEELGSFALILNDYSEYVAPYETKNLAAKRSQQSGVITSFFRSNNLISTSH